MSICPNCGTNLDEGAKFCASCGYEISPKSINPEIVSPSVKPVKDRIIAGILALLLGGLGIHKFYLNDTSAGILYICFSWTGIPEIIGLIEGIIYLTSTDEEFQEKYVKYI